MQTTPVSLKQRITGTLISVLFLSQATFAQTTIPDATVEAETGIRSGGVTIANTMAGFSGTGYVTNFKTTADKISVTINVATKGYYLLKITYYSDGDKSQNLLVNGTEPTSVLFPKNTTFSEISAGRILLNTGDNTVTIQSIWGYIHVDKFSVFSAQNKYNISTNLVNPNANIDAKSLYAFLLSKFTVNIISGHTSDWYDKVQPIAGKTPLLRAFDFQSYTQGYPYLWDDGIGGHSFGVLDDGTVQKAIDWYNQTDKKGLVSFQWHWHSPGGGEVSKNTFYTDYTNFDVRRAVVPGNTEYTKIIEDIDTIAYQLKRLQSAGVPVLWRPLHEAGGAWFWWGAKGPEACIKLYKIIYERLTDHHSLNNLIWVWSTPETNWYPGNDSVDIIGYDSYPGNYNYTIQKTMFDQLYNLTEGKKLIAMTENGPIPDIDKCFSEDAPWSYFMTWSNLITAQNSEQHIIDAYNNANVLTLENPTDVNDVSTDDKPVYRIFPNPASNILHIAGEDFSHLQIIDLNGRVVFTAAGTTNSFNIEQLHSGLYILKIYRNSQPTLFKILVNR